jgi:AcrR family transcriptional regulator
MVVPRHNKDNSPPKKTVQLRLLDVAESLFAEKGFDGTSIRELAAAADCNVASVNYYFTSKENLYREVWRRQLNKMVETRISSIEKVMVDSGGKPKLEDLLKSFSYAFLEPLLDQSSDNNLLRLMIRESHEQHLPPEMFVEEVISPTLSAMQAALLKTCPTLDKSRTVPIIFSLTGQLLHIVHVKAIFDRTEKSQWPELDVALLIEHIIVFTAAGIRAYSGGQD